MKILYVEDDKQIQESMLKFLSRRYKDILIADNGEDGLELYKKHKPDLVISDVQMPKMDGLLMTEEIKKIDSNVSIIITTAFNEAAYLLKGIELGVDKYILKPIDKKILLKAVEDNLLKATQQKIISENEEIISRILDDEPYFTLLAKEDNIQRVNKAFLRFLGYSSFNDFIQKNHTLKELCTNIGGYDKSSNRCWLEYIADDEGLIEEIILNGSSGADSMKLRYRKYPYSNITLFEFIPKG